MPENSASLSAHRGIEMDQLEQEILDFIKSKEYVSNGELIREFGQGDYCLEQERHLIIALSLEEEVVNALVNLRKRKEILPVPCSLLVCLSDGSPIPNPKGYL